MTKHIGPILAQRDNLTCIQCEACGYAHLTEFPSEATLSDYYKSDFWQHTKSGALADFERQAEWWNLIHNDWLECVEEHTRGRTLLDVGSGYGFFLHSAFARGWKIEGLEPNLDAAQYAQTQTGKAVWCGGWDNAHPFNGYKFDCISAHWLIEHLPNPLDFLLWCKSHLAPGGVLLAVIPQEWTEAQAAANEIVANKNFFVHHTHLNYFSQTSFANMLGRAGFRIVDVLATYPMEEFVTKQMTNYIDIPHLGRLAHKTIEARELSITREQRLAEYRNRAKYGRGRDLIVVAKHD